jgi:hypothetical protein
MSMVFCVNPQSMIDNNEPRYKTTYTHLASSPVLVPCVEGFLNIPIERRNHMALYPITRAAKRNLKREAKIDVVTVRKSDTRF